MLNWRVRLNLFLKDSIMNNYLLQHVVEFSTSYQTNKILLVVHKLHRTPYHLGIIYGDKYFALTINGADIKSKQTAFEALADKTANNLIIEINVDVDPQMDLTIFFENNSLNHDSFHSCLSPIKQIIAQLTTNNKFNDANNLFDLLDMLMEHNLVGQKSATRISPLMESKIVLMRYDTEAIKKHIKRLQEKNKGEQNQKNIS